MSYSPFGLLKALFTTLLVAPFDPDNTGQPRYRRFKNPAEDIPVWRLAQDIRDYKDALKMSQDEMSEEQWQHFLKDEKARKTDSTLHSFQPSKEELEEWRFEKDIAQLKQEFQENTEVVGEQEQKPPGDTDDVFQSTFAELEGLPVDMEQDPDAENLST